MRVPRIRIQSFMVVIVFLAIALWAGPIVVPEFARRWINCRQQAASYRRLATTYARMANKPVLPAIYAKAAVWNPWFAANFRKKADAAEKKAHAYRRALFIPWETWSAGY